MASKLQQNSASVEAQASDSDPVYPRRHIWGAEGDSWVAGPGLALPLVGVLDGQSHLLVAVMTPVLGNMVGHGGTRLSDSSSLFLELEP